jgi:flavin reductase (DIM6/NTAB) family NADH-FMN oxidoreductase RutF
MRQDFTWKDQTDLLWGALSSGGAFLVTLDPQGKPNPMTIGWGQIGIVWSRPVFSVLVRQSRYTFECLQAASTFTVSVPAPGTLKGELALCGTKSGRALDKFHAAGLTAAPAQHVETPIVAECLAHYECRILARTQQAVAHFADTDIVERLSYTDGNMHGVFFGEILASYMTRELAD